MSMPTRGRVIIDTTVGEIDIELWSRETPKTCRNFLALAMEGYYDGVIFHRVVPGFLVQTGDRTGTGAGGESFYGEPFEDEIHPRLRFVHRGLVAMANRGTKHSNDSQFILTLDRADELHGKHTLFGRCVGDTFYNVLKIGEMELDDNERPLYPPKIKSIRIVDNPFDDIVPRITAEEKRVQQRAKIQAQREREEAERRRGAKKNVKLLSFGGDDDEGEEEPSLKKAIIRPDLVEDQVVTAAAVPESVTQPVEAGARKETKLDKPPAKDKDKERYDITKIRERHAEEQASEQKLRKNEIAKMEAEIRKLAKRREGEGSEEEMKNKKAKKSYLEEETAKYTKGRGTHKKGKDGKRRVDESDVLAALSSFRDKLQSQKWLAGETDDVTIDEEIKAPGMTGDGNEDEVRGEDPGMEVDDDFGFMNHALHFPKDDGGERQKAERDYEVIDPRQRGAQAREEEKERRRVQKAGRSGGQRR
ncbi:hypothetical protein APHAL10511_002373 [Amanita phalloides]|nr:hypothetical protein APHAL10511_002373 [Amanita phalloides]